MLNKLIFFIKNNYRELIIVSVLFILGLALRTHNLSKLTTFNADQEWLAYRAEEILKGDIALIGPVTSVGNYSIGPIFVYMWAFFSLLTNGAPISGAYLSVAIGSFSLLMIYFFVRNFIDKKAALLTLSLVSISAPTIFWDQSPWTPSLFVIPQIMLLTGAYIINKNKLGYLLISLALVLGFQAHIGIVLSFIAVLVYLIFVKPTKADLATIVKSITIIFIGLVPNILFDVTHNFTNFYRLFDVIKGESVDYFIGIGKIINVLSYNSVSILYPNSNTLMDTLLIKVIYALVVVNTFRNLRSKKHKYISALLLVTVFIPAIAFYIQQGKFSEYYLMMTVPSSIFMVSLFLNDFINFKSKSNSPIYLKTAFILIVSIYTNFILLRNRTVDFNLKAKEDVLREIIKIAGTDNYGISLTTKYGDQFGFKYIIGHFKIKAELPPKAGETRIFSIIEPEGFDGMYGMKDFDGIGLRWSGI